MPATDLDGFDEGSSDEAQGAHDLSSVQQAIWLDQILSPDVPLYNIGLVWQIDGDLDPGLLEAAIGDIAHAHDALRLVVDEAGGAPFQRVLQRLPVALPVLDLTGLPGPQAEAHAGRHIDAVAGVPFELHGRPLWDSRLVRVGSTRHYWILRFHHLIADGVSLFIVSRAVADAYERRVRGEPPSTGEPVPSYLEFLARDRLYRSSSRHQADEQFWRDRFAALPAPLFTHARDRDLDRPESSASGRLFWRIGGMRFARLKEVAAASGCTLQHFMLALLGAYFSRTTRAEEVVFGVPVHNRATERDRRTVGLFSSMIPVGLRVDGDEPFALLIRRAAAELRRSYRHRCFPLAEINHALRLDQHGRRRLFDVTVAQQGYELLQRSGAEITVGDNTAGASRWTPDKMYGGFEQTPLAVSIREHPSAHAMVELNYRCGSFERSELERIQRRLERLMTAVLEGGETIAVAALPLMDEAERRQVLVEWNDTAQDYGAAAAGCVHELFEAQVERTPAAVAVVDDADGAQSLRYAELNARANQLARALRAYGVGPDRPVGVCLERSAEMVVSLLAVLKAGGCYVPLDPDGPVARLGEVLADSAPDVILVDDVGARALADVESGRSAVRVHVTAGDARVWPWAGLPAGNLARAGLMGTHLAYVIYTSGSTGRAKGVMNEHRGVVNRLLWMQEAYRLSERDVVLQKTPFGFDVSVWEFFWPLMAGAKLVMARPHGHRNPDYLARVIRRAGVTTLHFVPSMLQVFLADPGSASCTSLKRVISSGEALPAPLVGSLRARLPGVELHNLYGPTEAAVDVTAWTCPAGDASTAESIPIGRPIANVRIYILDERMEPVPMGVTGEIHIGGVQVARGYLNRPDLTEERFVDDPFAAGGRLYRTGDLGRWRPDGAIEYLSRNDSQVKIRGVRIELGEIEARLSRVPGVQEVVVVAAADAAGALLVAYYTGDQAPEPRRLQGHAAMELPAIMVPAAYVKLAAMPLMPNGKLDRRALPEPDGEAYARQHYQAPEGQIEAALAEMWAELLEVERVGRHDNFFALGGHSFLAVSLIERMRRQGLHADVRVVFTAPTLAALAAQLGPAGGVEIQGYRIDPGQIDARPSEVAGDRAALPSPEASGRKARIPYEAPRGGMEELLAGLWEDLLGEKPVGRLDNFFALGGHSLLVFQMVSRLRRTLGVDLRLGEVFEHAELWRLAERLVGGAVDDGSGQPGGVAGATVRSGADGDRQSHVEPKSSGAGAAHRAALVSELERRPRPAVTPDMVALVELDQPTIDAVVAQVEGGSANVQDIYPLAPLQEGIFFHHLLHERSGDPYLLVHLLALDSRERLDGFVAAMQEVIDRHDVLRTGIVWRGLEQPLQVVHRHVDLPFEIVSLDPREGDIAAQLAARYHPSRYQLDVGRAPLLACHAAWDEVNRRWLLHVMIHHLVSDHTTLELIVDEVRTIQRGERDQLPRPVPFRVFLAQSRGGVSREEHQAFFRQLLGDVDVPTEPFGVRDVRGDGGSLVEARQMLDPALSAAIRAAARRARVSAASIAHLAWAMVLARTTGQRDVVFGTLLFGRMRGGAQADRALGLFINMLPVRIGVGDGSALSALERMHALLARLLRHEHASLALAQRASGMPAHGTLFTSLLNYRHSKPDAVDRAGRARYLGDGIKLLDSNERTNYPVGLDVDDLGHGFMVTAQVVASIGARPLCDMMVQALSALVGALERDPDQPIGRLDVLPPAHREHLLSLSSTGPVAGHGEARCIHELVEEQAACRPEAIALVWSERKLSYRELNARANRLAHHLRALGVGPDDRVALHGPSTSEIAVAMLAVLKAGGAYVPLDPRYPPRRLGEVVDASRPVALLHRGMVPAEVAQRLGTGVPLLDLEADAEAWQHESEGDLVRQAKPHHLAYVIYTSGSTGQPRGVMVEHRGVANQNAALADQIHLGPGDRVLQFASLAFDASVEEVFATWARGATLVLRTDEWVADARNFWALCEEHQITVVDLPAQFWAQLAVEQGPIPTCVRWVLVGGETATERAWKAWFSIPGHRPRLLNAYGPTEATISVTAHEARGVEGEWRIIGRPSAGARVYVLDHDMRPAPAGVAGELYVGGLQVARGYLDQPVQTAARFIADPFDAGGRLYRTGDLGRWLPGGEIEYLGRNDFQVKIRGFRVELGEIEAVLAEQAGVREVAVVAREGESGGEPADGGPQLVAYYTGDEAPAATALRQHVARRLPAHMVPAAYVRLPALPTTPSGKLDRRALPAPGADARVQRGDQPPRTETERLIAALWQELLAIDGVGRHDNFFELGGHSLLAVHLVSRLRAAFGIELSLREVFENAELSRLARRVAGAASLPPQPILAAPRSGPLLLSLAQQRIWLLTRMERASQAYHISRAMRLTGELDCLALGRALRRIAERHEALRSCFRLVDDGPVQLVHAAGQLQIAEHDLTAYQDPNASAQALRRVHARAPFDLEAELPVRALLLRLSDREHELQVTMHQIASDDWSMEVFLDELGRLYSTYVAGDDDPLPALTIQYADHAASQRGRLARGELDGQIEFWRQALSGAPAVIELPGDRPRPAQLDHVGAAIEFHLDSEASRGIRALSRRRAVTPYMTVLASWAAALGRLSGQDEVVIGSPVAGRNRAEVEPLIGLFVNALPLRISLRGSPTAAELLARTRAHVMAAQENQDLPFDQIVEAVAPSRSLAYTPLFQVMLDWQVRPARDLRMSGLAVSPLGMEQMTAQFDLTLSLQEGEEGISGSLNYATALFGKETAQRILHSWIELLEAMVADDSQPIARLSLIPEAERRQMVLK